MRAALLMIGCLLSSLAFADIPPDPKYVETCTVKKQQKKGETCQSCSTYFKEANKCGDFLGTRGYTRRCKTAGASTWSEVWCQKGENLPNPLSVSPTTKPDAPVPEVKLPEPTRPPDPEAPESQPESQPDTNTQPAPTPPTTVKKKAGACAVEPSTSASSSLFLLGVFVGLFRLRRRTR